MGIGRLLRGILKGGDAQPSHPEGEPANGGPEQRRAPRVERLGWARYESGESEGQGLLTNLSATGALVERCPHALVPGAKLTLRLKPAGGHPSVSLEAEVVRTTPDSLALRFTSVDDEARAVIDEALSARSSED